MVEMEVKIRPLEWHDHGGIVQALTSFGFYVVEFEAGSWRFTFENDHPKDGYATEDAAKAAAQQDFATKARSALLPTTRETEEGEFTEGIMADGACILRDGVPVRIEEVLRLLNSPTTRDQLLEDMVGALERFEKTASVVANRGAVTGSHWVPFKASLIVARALLARATSLSGKDGRDE